MKIRGFDVTIYINAVVGFGARKANEDYGKILVSIVGFCVLEIHKTFDTI